VLGVPEDAKGVLPSQHLLKAIEAGWISAGGYSMHNHPEKLQPASLDLRLGERAFRIRSSFLPGGDTVERKVKPVIMEELNLHRESVLLEANLPYLVELKERLDLPNGVRARANPKSSTGRADVFTRVITDKSYQFDEIADGYSGPLFLEVVPLSFGIRVREDLSLNQLRLSLGRADLADEQIREEHRIRPILFRNGEPVPSEKLPLAGGLFLSLDLLGDDEGFVGYRARDNTHPLDLTLSGPIPSELFWEPVRHEERDSLVLKEEKFYLLMSEESVSVPPTLASEMTAYDPTSGELRTHYAGFFDPGFGYSPTGDIRGSRAALEVRAHDVPFLVEHRQRVCKLTFERMLEEPESLYGMDAGSSYQYQVDALGKQFIPPPRSRRAEDRPPQPAVPSDQRLF
jgi:dCTP deaminase